MEVTLNGYYTMILATLVLLLGRFLVKKIKFLEDFNIPEPVAGGLLAAVVVYALNFIWGYSFNFQQELQTACMLMFFASIGLSADFGRLKAGGTPLLIFTVVVSAFIVIQDIVGVSMAALLGLDPLLGLVTGSIALTGGHGTAGAWGITLEQQYGVVGATTLGIAVATYGLVAGGVIGGPVARRLINQLGLNLPLPTLTPVKPKDWPVNNHCTAPNTAKKTFIETKKSSKSLIIFVLLPRPLPSSHWLYLLPLSLLQMR